MISCEIELDLSWTKYYVLTEQNNNIAGVNFVVTNTKLYASVVTLSIDDNTKLLRTIKQRFGRTISQNKYRSEITTQSKNNNLDYLIHPTFKNINRLLVLSFKNGNNDPTRNSFERYYMPFVEIKYFNELINNRPFFDQPVKKQTRSI